MKKIISLIFIFLLAIIPLENIQANKIAKKFDSIGINIYNGTGSAGTITVSGPTSFSTVLKVGGWGYGPILPGSYTVTLAASSGGTTRTYNFMGQSNTNDLGYAVFNVNIQNTAFGTVN